MDYNKISKESKIQKGKSKQVDVESVLLPDDEKLIESVVVNCHRVNVRTMPSKGSPVICTLNEGDQITIKEIANGWAHINADLGVEGYVMKEFIREV